MRTKLLFKIIGLLLFVSHHAKAQDYCSPVSHPNSEASGYYIKDFTTTGGLVDISNMGSGFSSPNGYGNFSGTHWAVIRAGQTLSFSFVPQADNSYYYNIWVDYNNDKTFQLSEMVHLSGGFAYGTYNGSFTIPANTPAGSYRMRVLSDYWGQNNPCATNYFGETEDYTLTVIPADACWAGDIELNTQAQITYFVGDNFSCDHIAVNNLTIGYASGTTESNITSLLLLMNIKTVTGNLTIRKNPDLTNLNGLQNITTFSGGYLRIDNNAELTDIAQLSNITSVGYLNIRDNAKLASLFGLQNLTKITGSGTGSGYLYIHNNEKLTSISYLSGLTSIGNYIQIQQNELLQSLNGLHNVTSVNGNIIVQDNPVLNNIQALKGIAHTSISGTGNGLTIRNNPELSVCNLPNFCQYLQGSGNRTIENNKEYCLTEQAIQNTCGICPSGKWTFDTQQKVDDFGALYANCTDITLGDVTIGLWTNITDLTPLQNIKNITGNLNIRDNSNLPNLNGLHNITSIGGFLQIYKNGVLQNLDGLNNLTSTGTDVAIASNGALTDINGLNNLTSIGGELNIRDNPNLPNLDGFTNLTSIGTNLRLSSNEALTNLDGLNNLTSIGGHLNIYKNGALTNLNGFTSLTSIGEYLRIERNGVLTDISGLQNIDSNSITGTTGLRIKDNANLSVCNLPNFCTYLSNPAKPREITGNKEYCLDEQAIQNTCGTCPSGNWVFDTQQKIDDFALLFPNCTDITLGNVTIGVEVGSSDITDLTPLQNIKNLTGWLSINRNGALQNLDGLNSLTSVGSELNIYQNGALENLDGLNSLTSIGGFLRIENNGALTDISGLQNIDPNSIGIAGMFIVNNSNLSVCNLPNFCTYLSNPAKPRNISGNKDNCLDNQAVLDDCFWHNITLGYKTPRQIEEMLLEKEKMAA